MRASVDRRIRVQIVRRRLEGASADVVERVRCLRPTQHRRVAARLLMLAALVRDQQRPATLDLARRAGRVYRSTSDVMHSRRAFGDVPEYLVQEWEATVEDVETLLGSVAPSRSSKEV